jgi:hypothetical protein
VRGSQGRAGRNVAALPEIVDQVGDAGAEHDVVNAALDLGGVFTEVAEGGDGVSFQLLRSDRGQAPPACQEGRRGAPAVRLSAGPRDTTPEESAGWSRPARED